MKDATGWQDDLGKENLGTPLSCGEVNGLERMTWSTVICTVENLRIVIVQAKGRYKADVLNQKLDL